MKKVNILILGGGPAGISAAIWSKRLNLSHLLIESKAELGGQLHQIKNNIIDYPGFQVSNGLELQQKFTTHLNSLSCDYMLESYCTDVNLTDQTVMVTSKGKTQKIAFNFLIIATGASPRKLGIPGEQEMIARGEVFSTSQDSHKFKNKTMAIVGGGDRALEGAYNLARKGARIYLIHRSTRFRARDDLLQATIAHNNVTVLTNANVEHIYDNGEKVTGIAFKQNNILSQMDVDGILIRIGTKANSDLILEEVELDHDGYILVDQLGQTTKDNVFAIGDVCTSPLYSSISTAVGQGMQATKKIAILDKNRLTTKC
ncbi:thioredoxin reductase (NADPH) [Oceanobacillus limi]|uniref:Thioredoxin reductase (NADPH) n=1 Tax=Oceanobacillus limi TaxID=930131 RepID=A0A1I0AHY8_9BACI|nr:NAD(P)/FAD-dependent oxidoreductase [Oceanobacillus limi]SES92887.1 thioredoxin reductase (NADPH) [Oceanobacillus limi]